MQRCRCRAIRLRVWPARSISRFSGRFWRERFTAAIPQRGGRPGFDVVLKFEILVLQALYGLSLEQTEYAGARPAELDALLRTWPVGPGAGLQHALEFPRGLDPGQGARSSIYAIGPGDW